MTARLHHFLISHYNEKVRWALDFKQWPHERVAITPGLHFGKARKLSRQTQLPILELDGEVLTGSAHIVAELERRRPEPPLFPEVAADRERACLLEAHFDEHVAPQVRTLFWWAYLHEPGLAARMITLGKSRALRFGFRVLLPVLRRKFSDNIGLDAERVRVARAELAEHFARVERELQPSGYLVGDRFTVADLAVASILSAIVRPPEFPYQLPQPLPSRLVELQGSVRATVGYRWVERIYARHRGVSAEI